MTSIYENGGEEAVWFTRLHEYCIVVSLCLLLCVEFVHCGGVIFKIPLPALSVWPRSPTLCCQFREGGSCEGSGLRVSLPS